MLHTMYTPLWQQFALMSVTSSRKRMRPSTHRKNVHGLRNMTKVLKVLIWPPNSPVLYLIGLLYDVLDKLDSTLQLIDSNHLLPLLFWCQITENTPRGLVEFMFISVRAVLAGRDIRQAALL